jgi:hypothetical protein
VEIFFSTVDDSFYTEIFQEFVAFIGISNPASSDTDTTLSLALKQFDAQNDKKIYLRFHTAVFLSRKRKEFSRK